MPQASAQLREMFLRKNDDGIETCKYMIQAAGGTIRQGVIKYTGNNIAVLNAIEYLCDEWDFSYDHN